MKLICRLPDPSLPFETALISRHRVLNPPSTEPWYERCTFGSRKPSPISKPEDDPPVVPKLEGSWASALSFADPGLPLHSPRSTFSPPRPIVPQLQAYFPAVSGISSRSFRLIFPQFQAYSPSVPGLSSLYLPSVVGISVPGLSPPTPVPLSHYS
jgi:hypothetical protein